MGRTRHQFYRSNPYELGFIYKSRRNQIPILKRKVRHSFRRSNKFADQLTFQSFSSNSHYKVHCDQGYQTGSLRGMKYDFGSKNMLNKLNEIKSKPDEINLLIKEIRKKVIRISRFAQRRIQNWIADIRKKLKRRKTLKPFKGHRKPGQLYKRELFF